MLENSYSKVNVYGENQRLKLKAGLDTSSRDADAQALLSCASRMREAKELLAADVKSKKNLSVYGEALRKNQRLWTIFQVAVTDPSNPLPQSLKNTLFELSRYVDKTSLKAIGKYAPDLVDSLININRILAEGLRKKVVDEEGEAPMTEAPQLSRMTSA
ncbi:MAG: flagellar biosynthesis regulator FlaF [Alphaproteobacteria bacterium]|nr:flagellar biosynthesis regulator FlaF [Alphaproteobacteria bacterium]